eukprot:365452-Chlamydomonas_euryale.AAC.12
MATIRWELHLSRILAHRGASSTQFTLQTLSTFALRTADPRLGMLRSFNSVNDWGCPIPKTDPRVSAVVTTWDARSPSSIPGVQMQLCGTRRKLSGTSATMIAAAQRFAARSCPDTGSQQGQPTVACLAKGWAQHGVLQHTHKKSNIDCCLAGAADSTSWKSCAWARKGEQRHSQ